MATFLRLSAFVGALLVLTYGFSGTDESADRVWLICLAITGVLLTVGLWPRGTRSLPLYNRTLLRWSSIVLVGFALVSLQLVRVQIARVDVAARQLDLAVRDAAALGKPRARVSSAPKPGRKPPRRPVVQRKSKKRGKSTGGARKRRR